MKLNDKAFSGIRICQNVRSENQLRPLSGCIILHNESNPSIRVPKLLAWIHGVLRVLPFKKTAVQSHEDLCISLFTWLCVALLLRCCKKNFQGSPICLRNCEFFACSRTGQVAQ